MEYHFARLIICHSKRVPAECRYLPILWAYALRIAPCFRIAYPLYTIYPPDRNLVGKTLLWKYASEHFPKTDNDAYR